ncbi:hypothetical protein ACFQ9X_31495 [Catenulispora yoronensis]
MLHPMPLDSDLRCHRLLLMAAAASTSGVAEHWIREQPNSPDGFALAARTAVVRAVRARRCGAPELRAWITEAEQACARAAERFASDPVPHVARLQLAAIRPDPAPDPDRAVQELERLLSWVVYCAPASREGHFRLVTAVARQLGEKRSGYLTQAAFKHCANAAAGSPLHLLPLVALVEIFRMSRRSSQPERVIFADQCWSTAPAKQQIHTAFELWFRHRAPGQAALLPDLHLLAHALCQARLFAQAAAVFEAIGRWGWSEPWSLHSTQDSSAGHVLAWAYNSCLDGVARNRTAPPRASRPGAVGLHTTG